MEIMQQFLAYAGDFEKTLADDNWARLRQYFADDAVYDVKSDLIGCTLTGSAAIFACMKKSLDGFDRKFTSRDIAVTSGPEIDGNELRMVWTVTYHKGGWSDFVLRGRSIVRYREGKIVYLSDLYEPSMEVEFATWERQNGVQLDASYI